MKQKKKKRISQLLSTLGASLLGNLLTGKDTIRAGEDTTRAADGTIRAGQGFLMPPHPLTNLKYKSIIRTNLNLMVFIQEIIY